MKSILAISIRVAFPELGSDSTTPRTVRVARVGQNSSFPRTVAKKVAFDIIDHEKVSSLKRDL